MRTQTMPVHRATRHPLIDWCDVEHVARCLRPVAPSPRRAAAPQPCFSIASVYSFRIVFPAAAVHVVTPDLTAARFVRPRT